LFCYVPCHWSSQDGGLVLYESRAWSLWALAAHKFVTFLTRIVSRFCFHLFFHYFLLRSDHDYFYISGIAITRGAAAALTFCYSVLLLTVCRNLISKMKELSLHQYIPLDSNIQVSSPSTSTYLVKHLGQLTLHSYTRVLVSCDSLFRATGHFSVIRLGETGKTKFFSRKK
jgi:hypothetical protein